jgi:hypothetical protein
MHKSSIHFREASPTSEAHNMRQVKLDYNEPSLEVNNESIVVESIADRLKKVQSHCKKVSGRKLQKNAQVIREAVVNLKPGTSMDDLKRLANELKTEFGINCFQIHIHRDEGHRDPMTGEFKINDHAHMLFDWQDKEKGTVLKLNKAELSQIQTLVANVLDMERGQLRVNSNRERLEPIEYKRQQAELQLQQLQEQNNVLEQKKNEVRARIERLTAERAAYPGETNSEANRSSKEAFRELILVSEDDWTKNGTDASKFDENDLIEAIRILEEEIKHAEANLKVSK